MATYATYRHIELDNVGCGKKRDMKPPGGDCHDIFGADFSGTPSHHRVLKPPGGGTSDIFNGSGGGLPSGDEPPRRVRNMQPSSKLFGEGGAADQADSTTNGGGSARKQQNGHQQQQQQQNNHQQQHGNADSHWRLFGTPPAPQHAAPARKPANQRLFGAPDGDGWKQRRHSPRHGDPPSNNNTPSSVGSRHVKRRPDGNPVTGEGYESEKNGTVSSSSSEAGSVASLGSEGVAGAGAATNGSSTPGGGKGGSSSRARVPPGGYSSGFW